jgi:hypothetical protein
MHENALFAYSLLRAMFEDHLDNVRICMKMHCLPTPSFELCSRSAQSVRRSLVNPTSSMPNKSIKPAQSLGAIKVSDPQPASMDKSVPHLDGLRIIISYHLYHSFVVLLNTYLFIYLFFFHFFTPRVTIQFPKIPAHFQTPELL